MKAIPDHEFAKGLAIEQSNKEYHARPEVSVSQLHQINRSPAHFWHYKSNPQPQTPAMRLGSLIHDAVLLPQLFLQNTVVMQDFDRRTKAGKDGHATFMAGCEGKDVVTAAEYEQIKGITDSVMSHKSAGRLLSNSHNELSFFGKHDETGVGIRCRPDALHEHHIVVDLKTTADASFKGFQRSVGTFRYAVQAAFYLDLLTQVTGSKYDTFVFVAVEKEPPYGVAVYVLDEASIECGREHYRRDLATYAKCLAEKKWPAYSDDIQPMAVPHWFWSTVQI